MFLRDGKEYLKVVETLFYYNKLFNILFISNYKLTKGIEDKIKDERKLQLKNEVEPGIEAILRELSFDSLLFEERYRQGSKSDPEIYSQFYFITSPKNIMYLDFTYDIYKDPNIAPNFSVSYHKFIAWTPTQIRQLKSSGLLERVKSLLSGVAITPTAEYIEVGSTDSGIIVRCSPVDRSNPEELANVAGYIKQVDSLVTEYMQAMQTKKAVIRNRKIH